MIKKIIFLISILSSFIVAQNPNFLKLPIKLNPLIDGFEVVNGDTVLNVFMKTRPNTQNQLQSLGISLSTPYSGSLLQSGKMSVTTFRTVMVTNPDEIEWMSVSGKAFPLDQASDKMIRAGLARNLSGSDGNGVIIGIVDLGTFDYKHQDFKDGNGNSRVLNYWWQRKETESNSPQPYNYGQEFSANQLGNSGTVPIQSHFHSTHVAGIAASSDQTYTGVAPSANLIFVNILGNSLDDPNLASYGTAETHVFDGIAYCMKKAIELNKPWVVNVSVGSNQGPHDGTAPFDLAVNSLYNLWSTGGAIVVAAGNDQDDKRHYRSTTNQTIEANISFSSTNLTEGYLIEIFYPSSSNYSVSVQSPNPNAHVKLEDGSWSTYYLKDITITPGRGTGGYSNGLAIGYLSEDGFVGIHNADFPTFPTNLNPYPYTTNKKCIRIFIQEHVGVIQATSGTWKISLKNSSGQWDAYLVGRSRDVSQYPDPTFISTSCLEDNITMPGTAANVITVGSVVSDNTYPNNTPTSSSLLNSISVFSGLGSSSNNKPEIYAPGETISSTLSSNYNVPVYEQGLIETDGKHISFQGTSMAAPHVTGAVALLLQQNPTWTAGQIKERLKNTANFTYGYPILDVNAALCKDNNSCKQNPGSSENKEVEKNLLEKENILSDTIFGTNAEGDTK